MPKKTFLTIAYDTLNIVGIPLTDKEIWQHAQQKGITQGFQTTGKTPIATLGAQLYTDMKNKGGSSVFRVVSRKPTKFALNQQVESTVSLVSAAPASQLPAVPVTPLPIKASGSKVSADESVKERELHALLTAYVKSHSHFKASAKTIFHEASKKGAKGFNEWLHPDLAGVYYPFQDFKSETLQLQQSLSVSSVKLFSFEMKIRLTLSNLRQYYFQAVSNSSWANEGYLVLLHLDEDDNLRDEISRLNNAFGIGVILLNAASVQESVILFPARVRPEIDWNTLNRLVKENEFMRELLKNISDSMQIKKVVGNYDKVLSEAEMQGYIKQKQIK